MLRKLINFLKTEKKANAIASGNTTDNSTKIVVNNKEYLIEKSVTLPIQHTPSDVKIYGWCIECRWRRNNGEWYNWFNYWNHKIYQSRESAIDASIKISKSFNDREFEYRVAALYKMEMMQYREYKIDQLLNNNQKTTEKVMTTYKLKEDQVITYPNSTYTYKKNTLFIKRGKYDVIMCATPTKPTRFLGNSRLDDFLKNGLVEEVDILNEKWYHPHLIKPIKDKVLAELKNKN